MKMTGAQVMVEVLKEHAVDTVFGYPGGAILPFYDALRDSPVRHILVTHEQNAAHAADGYGRATGKVGVCVATSGPGATNLVTGLATAFLDSKPMVAITGQVGTSFIGRDAFQEADITGVTMPVTKHNFLVKRPEQLAGTLRLAFQLAKTGRPGPVLVDIPRDVQTAEVDYTPARLTPPTEPQPDMQAISKAVEAINKAKRPVMLVGGGVIASDGEYDAMHLCEKMHIPVVSTLMGLGCISAYRKLFLGMTGLHGHARANNAIKNCDLLLAVGTRFNDRVTGERHSYQMDKTIVHLDVDPAELDKNINATIGIPGDMNMTLRLLEAGCRPMPHQLDEWWQEIDTWPQWNEDYTVANEAPKFMDALNPILKDQDFIITTDVGQHQMWAAQHLKIQFARQFITSGGCGTMGFGLPSAMGAALARPDAHVISISGDGGFKMTGSELYTLAWHQIPVTAIVFNNGGLGMIRQLQTVFFDKRMFASDLPPCLDFVKYAAAFGIAGERVDTPEALAAAVKKAWELRKPYLIEVTINPDNMAEPMVAATGSINTFFNFDEK